MFKTTQQTRRKHTVNSLHDFNRTKIIQVIQQIKKQTIDKFKNLTKKFMFLRKSKYELQHPSKTQKQQRINASLIIADQEHNVTSIVASPLMNHQSALLSHPELQHNQNIRQSPIIIHTTERHLHWDRQFKRHRQQQTLPIQKIIFLQATHTCKSQKQHHSEN